MEIDSIGQSLPYGIFSREFTPTQSLDRRLSKVSARAREHGKIRIDLRKRPPQTNAQITTKRVRIITRSIMKILILFWKETVK